MTSESGTFEFVMSTAPHLTPWQIAGNLAYFAGGLLFVSSPLLLMLYLHCKGKLPK